MFQAKTLIAGLVVLVAIVGITSMTSVFTPSSITQVPSDTQTAVVSTPSVGGLVGYWAFDGNANDLSGNARNASLMNGARYTSNSGGKIGKALSLGGGGAGSPSYVSLPSISASGDFTVSAWVKGTFSKTSSALIGGSGGRMMFRGSSEYIDIGGTVQQSLSTDSNVGNWVHVTIVRSGTSASYYRNGSLIGSWTVPNTTLTFSYIGTDNVFDNGNSFVGSIDDVRVYNRALSSDEIVAIKNYTDVVTPPSDPTPPTFTNISASNITTSGVTISWTTDEASDSQVQYGPTDSYSYQTALDTAKSTSHSVTISGLTTGTVYHYRVLSRDAANNLGTSGDYTFTTASTPPVSTKFDIGDSIVTTQVTATRNAPADYGTNLGNHAIGEKGTITSGPISAGGFIWWNINYNIGADGWSGGEDRFEKDLNAGNTPPTVSLSASPTAGIAPLTSTLTATASDSDGNITKVEFYNGTSLISTDSTSSYTASFTIPSSGTRVVTAKAYDNDGAVTTSNSVTIIASQIDNPTDTTIPVVNTFTIPATSASLTVPVSAFSATDNTGVTGYIITESATKPASTATGWTASAPTSYTFTTQGTKTLYAYAKDAANNVSNGKSDGVVVTIPSGNYTLTVTKNGSDYVYSTPTGINCAGTLTCTMTVPAGTSVTITNTPNAGNTFVGYGGACTGNTCTVTVNANTNITATFLPTPTTFNTTDKSRVITNTTGVNVRSIPVLNIAGSVIGTQAAQGVLGTILGGPVYGVVSSIAYWWWNVDFDTGTDGWVAGDLLSIAPTVTYTITASAGANGTISPAGVTTVNSGTNKTFTISPNAGYQVASVTVDGVSQGAISSYTFNNVTAAHTISATFSVAPVVPTATISANPTNVTSGNASTITWSSTNATSCSVTKAGAAWQTGLSNTAGVSSGNLTSGTTFSITCTNANGTSPVASVKVTVGTPGTDPLPADRRVDWSKAGVQGGIPNRTTIYQTLGQSGKASSFVQNVTASAIQTALNNAPANSVVKLSAGTYNISGTLKLKSNVTLRGAGMGNTIIKMSSGFSGSNGIQFDNSFDANWSASHIGLKSPTKGATTLTTSSTHGWKIGDIVLVDMVEDPSGDPAIDNAGSLGNCAWCGRESGNRPIGQWVKVIGVPSTTSVTIDPPLYWSYNKTPQGTKMGHVSTGGTDPAVGIIEYAGLEDLTLNNLSAGVSYVVEMQGAVNSWLNRVEILGAYGPSKGRAVWGYGTLWFTIQGSRIIGDPNGVDLTSRYTSDQMYGIYMGPHYTAGLITDNIIEKLTNGVDWEGASAGNVVSYNYIGDMYWKSTGGDYPRRFGMLMHGPHPFMNLIEGNWSNERFRSDEYWGTASHFTLLRNRIMQRDRGGASNGLYAQAWVVDVERRNQYYSLIGNILGKTGVENTYELSGQSIPYDGGPISVYKIGYKSLGLDSSLFDSKTLTSMIRFGNWASKLSSGAAGLETGNQASIPNSYYLGSKPAFFGSLTWPPFDPNNASAASVDDIPAGYRYVHGTNPPGL